MNTITTEMQQLKEQSAHCLQVASAAGDTSGAAYHALMLGKINAVHKTALALDSGSSLNESISTTRSFFSPRS